MTAQALVDAYISELTAAARLLPAHRRAELIADVREHIRAALGGTGAGDEAAVRNVLERLGSPDEIVAAARDEREPQIPRARSLTPARLAIAALTGLLVLLLALLSGTSGLPAAVMAIAFAVVTPYVWIPLVLTLLALAARREPQPAPPGPSSGSWTRASSRRVSPSLIGLGAIVVLLLVALLANGLLYMGIVAVLAVPLLVLLLLVEALRSRRG